MIKASYSGGTTYQIGEQMAHLTVRFGTDTSKKIEQVAKEMDIDQKELLRRALAVYIYLVNETRDGNRRVSITDADDDKVLKNIELSFP